MKGGGTNSKNTYSCRNLFKKLKILPFYSQYTFSSLLYVVNNKHLSQIWILITSVQEIRSKPHPPIPNIAKFQKGAFNSGIQIFIYPPSYIKSLSHEIKLLRPALKRFLYSNPFYTLEKYLN
jgi:hypothetical protein